MRVVALMLPLAALAGCSAPVDERGLAPGETILKISATGQGQAKPDTASFTAGVNSFGPSALAASDANNQRMAAVIAAIEALGVAKDDIQTQNVSVDRSYYNRATKRYEASNSVSVKVRKIDDAGKVMAAATKAGANEVNGPNFSIENLEAINEAAIAAVYKNAKARADAYAKAMGLRVDRVLKADDQPNQDNVMVMAETSAADAAMPRAVAPPIRTGMNSATANAVFEFVLAPE